MKSKRCSTNRPRHIKGKMSLAIYRTPVAIFLHHHGIVDGFIKQIIVVEEIFIGQMLIEFGRIIIIPRILAFIVDCDLITFENILFISRIDIGLFIGIDIFIG